MKVTKIKGNKKSYVSDKKKIDYVKQGDVPPVITLRQFKLVLANTPHSSGKSLLLVVNDFIENIQDENMRTAVLVEWRYANDMERNSPTLNKMVDILGISQEQLDQFFIAGAKL